MTTNTPDKDAARRVLFGRLVGRVSRDWRRAADRRLQPHGLTEATWLPLLHIARAPTPPRQKDLAASLALEGSSVVRLLDALEAAGLVTRREGESDRRAKVIELTAAGRRMVAQVEAVGEALRAEMLAGIPARDLAVATRVLERVGALLAADAGADDDAAGAA
jgi:MarR family transcriptional regulator for hemolysin